MKLKITLLVFALASTVNFAQSKIATIDSEYIVTLMPETKKATELLQKFAKKLDSSYQIKVKDYTDKIEAYKKLDPSIGENFKKVKVKEIQELETELQKKQNTNSSLLQLKRNELMRPVYKKLSTSIQEMAKIDGYTQVLTTSGNEFAYIDEKYDLTEKILKKLGIPIPKPETKK